MRARYFPMLHSGSLGCDHTSAQHLRGSHLRWFEVIQTRGHIEHGKVRHYQVTLKVGFTLDSSVPD